MEYLFHHAVLESVNAAFDQSIKSGHRYLYFY